MNQPTHERVTRTASLPLSDGSFHLADFVDQQEKQEIKQNLRPYRLPAKSLIDSNQVFPSEMRQSLTLQTSSRKLMTQLILIKVMELKMDYNMAQEILISMNDYEFIDDELNRLIFQVINKLLEFSLEQILVEKRSDSIQNGSSRVYEQNEQKLLSDAFKCNICSDYYMKVQTYMILPCEHIFCCECVRLYLQNQIMSSKVEGIMCPQQDCATCMNDQTIQSQIDIDLYNKMIKFRQIKLLSQNENLKFCPRPGCELHVVRMNQELILTCGCNQRICFQCSNAEHGSKSCGDALDKTYRQAIIQYKIQKCPSCSSPIQKSDGCNHMTCYNCQHQFCWLCSELYCSNHYNKYNIFGCPGLQFSEKEPFTYPKLYRAILFILLICIAPLGLVLALILLALGILVSIYTLPLIALGLSDKQMPVQQWIEHSWLGAFCFVVINFVICTILLPFSIVVTAVAIVGFVVLGIPFMLGYLIKLLYNWCN